MSDVMRHGPDMAVPVGDFVQQPPAPGDVIVGAGQLQVGATVEVVRVDRLDQPKDGTRPLVGEVTHLIPKAPDDPTVDVVVMKDESGATRYQTPAAMGISPFGERGATPSYRTRLVSLPGTEGGSEG